MFEKYKDQNESLSVSDLDFDKFSGLLTVIALENGSGRVLMLAYANLEAVRKTQETGNAHYWSRSRNTIWKKRKNFVKVQQITEVLVAFEEDNFLYKISQTRPACHTVAQCCFYIEFQGRSQL